MCLIFTIYRESQMHLPSTIPPDSIDTTAGQDMILIEELFGFALIEFTTY